MSTIDKLRNELQRAYHEHTRLSEIGRFLARAVLNQSSDAPYIARAVLGESTLGLDVSPDLKSVGMSAPWLARFFGESLLPHFEKEDGTFHNFLSVRLEFPHEKLGRLEVFFQRADGKTPGERVAELTDRITLLEKQVRGLGGEPFASAPAKVAK